LKKLLRRTLLAIVALVAVAGVGTERGRYIARAAVEESRILLRRRAIEDVIADSATRPALRQRLMLVRDARAFAVRELGLVSNASFTAYSQLDRDTLVLVLSAARRDTLAPVTWWFPVVGRVPYKGYFDATAARAARDELKRRGFDTYLRPASAFSTLGWFNDPLLSTTVGQDTLDLANTVIHELLHNTLFVKGQVAFNESFASFVGARGAAGFFRSRGAAAAAERVDAMWEDDKLLGTFWAATARAIDSVYAVPGRDSSARIAARDSVYAFMRRVLLEELGPRMPTTPRAALERIPLDNASLLARRLYAEDLFLFDEVHRRSGGGLRETIALVRQVIANAEDPYRALRHWIAGR
jgi:predicted aminopeptidase